MKLLTSAVILVLSFQIVYGGRNLSDELSKVEISEQIGSFINEVKTFSYTLSTAQSGQLKTMKRHASIMDARWNDFYSKAIDAISQDEMLLGMATDYEQLWMAAMDSLNLSITRMEKVSVYMKDEQFVMSRVEPYRKLGNEAMKLSLIKQTAPQLEKLKAREQLEFAKIEEAFNEASEAAAINPILSERMKKLQDTFIEVKLSSDKIQQTEFKPFLDRIKDYLMSLAAVSIIAMFGIFLSNYAKTAKKAKEARKKMEEALDAGNQTTPTI